MKQPNSFNPEYQTRGALLVGPVIPKKDITTGERLGVMPRKQNSLPVAKLGLTVVGARFIRGSAR